MKFVFLDGTTLDMPHITPERASHVVAATRKWGGLTLLMSDGQDHYPLTPCCLATGKGLYDEEEDYGYVGCRNCYVEVKEYMGDYIGPREEVIPRVDLLSRQIRT